jgi:hypothetical protein
MPEPLGTPVTPERIRALAQDERVARHAGFWWGLAEGLFFFIVPDVYIAFAALFSLRAGAAAWLFSIAGSLVAIVGIYVLVVALGTDYLGFLAWIPGIPEALVARVREQLATGGLPYTPLLVLGGVPLKVYGGVAFSLGGSLGTVLLWTVFARIVRIAPTFAVMAILRLLLGRIIDARPAAWCAVLAFFWVAFYVVYFSRMSAG